MSEWQPIETAPKDGTRFIALSRKGVCQCVWRTIDLSDHPADLVFRWWDNPDDAFWFEIEEDAPTHWMPLPKLPVKDVE